jgi:uncharacterized membrane protein
MAVLFYLLLLIAAVLANLATHRAESAFTGIKGWLLTLVALMSAAAVYSQSAGLAEAIAVTLGWWVAALTLVSAWRGWQYRVQKVHRAQ